MKYHNNAIKFTCKVANMSIISGSYTINSYYVTSGQDPKRKIYNGKVSSMMYPNLVLSFSVGRKGSESTANWFNSKVPYLKTTFGHSAGKLNFAFVGSLKLFFLDGSVYTFNDIALAQGHAGTSNNWWFGGATCVNIRDNKVDCTGTDSSGKKCYFVFERGGLWNSVNEIEIIKIRKGYDNSGLNTSWMNNILDDSLPLRDLTIPGTHDSGTKDVLNIGGARCQNFDIEKQLKDGIRFFDIRLKTDRELLSLYHGPMPCNLGFGQVLVWCRDFLEANPSETILMSVKEESGYIWNNFRNYMSAFLGLFIHSSLITTIGESRGKIVLFRRFNDKGLGVNWFGNGLKGDAWVDNDEFIINYSQEYCIYDKYKLSDTKEKMKELEVILHNSNRTQDINNRKKLYVNFSSIAYNYYFVNARTPFQYAWGGNGVDPAINPSLISFLENNPGTNRWGIVILDFYNREGENNKLVDLLIASNKDKRRNKEDDDFIKTYDAEKTYFVNLNNPNLLGGLHHEIHRGSCKYLPYPVNRYLLGVHENAESALKYAKEIVNADVDGCYYCCNEVHKK